MKFPHDSHSASSSLVSNPPWSEVRDPDEPKLRHLRKDGWLERAATQWRGKTMRPAAISTQTQWAGGACKLFEPLTINAGTLNAVMRCLWSPLERYGIEDLDADR